MTVVDRYRLAVFQWMDEKVQRGFGSENLHRVERVSRHRSQIEAYPDEYQENLKTFAFERSDSVCKM